MLFHNPQIPVAELPTLEEVHFQALPRQALRLRLIGWAIIQGFLLLTGLSILLVSGLLKQSWWWWVYFPFWGLQALYFYWLTRKQYHREAYAIREKDIVHIRGYWRRSQLSVPYSRVQHVVIKQGPVGRHLGLGSIKIYTAGTMGGHMSISDIEFGDAERMKQFIAQKVGADD